MLKGLISDEHGVTLMELIIVIMIMSVVGLLVFRIISFGLDSYSYGVSHVDHQAMLRMSAYKMTEELRNVRQVNLVDGKDEVSLDEYIYLDGSAIKHEDAGGAVTSLSDDLVVSVTYLLSENNGHYILTFTLTAVNGDSISTEVLLNNITQITVDSGDVIEFDFNPPIP